VHGLERGVLFSADTDRDDVVARVAVLAAVLGGQPRLIPTVARSVAATVARWSRLLRRLQDSQDAASR
jgi:hypothetical protein